MAPISLGDAWKSLEMYLYIAGSKDSSARSKMPVKLIMAALRRRTVWKGDAIMILKDGKMDGDFVGRRVCVDGRNGTIENTFFQNGEFHSAMILYDTFDPGSARVQVIRSFTNLMEWMLPEPELELEMQHGEPEGSIEEALYELVDLTVGGSDDEAMDVTQWEGSMNTPCQNPSPMASASVTVTADHRMGTDMYLAGPSEPVAEDSESYEEMDEDESEPFERSLVHGVPMPIYGNDDDHYVKGSTGKWYPKELAIKEGDTELSVWIDGQYDKKSVWPVSYLVDSKTDRETGVTKYLVKFEEYELNPGLADCEDNPGDWYGVNDGISRELLEEFQARTGNQAQGSK